METPRLSVIMIAKNEEARLPKCLDSIVGLADETVIVDTGSTDDTVKIAQSKGARVIRQEWRNDFSEARNRSIQEASGDHLLWLDADDIVPKIEHAKIRDLAAQSGKHAFSFIIENEYEGRPGQAFRQVRLFPSGQGIRFEGRIHETLSLSLSKAHIPVTPCEVRIVHTGYNSAAERNRKTQRNHLLLQEESKAHPDDPVVLMELGNSFFQMKDLDRAIEIYLRLEKLPGAKEKQREVHQTVPVLLGTAFFEQGLLEDAKKWFEQGISRDPENIAAYYFLGQIALRGNDPDTLLAMSEKVVSLPEVVSTIASDVTGMKANAYAFAGNLHFVRGNFKRALELFAEADKSGLPVAFQYQTASEAAQKAGDKALASYFQTKASSQGKD